MKNREQKRQLLQHLLSLLVGQGFEEKIHGQSFWRFTNGGRLSVHLSFIDHNEDFDITVDVSIRFDELETLKNECRGDITQKQKLDTYTLGVEIGNLLEGKQRRWSVGRNSDLNSLAKDIYQTLADKVMPVVIPLSNPETAFELMLRDDKEARLFQPFPDQRAINAVGLAKLMKKTEILQEVIQRKTRLLRESEDYLLDSFLAFVNHIK